MNVRFLMLAGVAIACAGPARADGPWYISGSVGGYFREDDSFATRFHHSNDPTFTVPGTNTESFDSGVIGNFAVGYSVMPQVRLEAELGYTDYTLSTLNPLAHDPHFPRLTGATFVRQYGARFSRFTGTVNAFYDFMPIAGFTPYAGVGIGASDNRKGFGFFTGPTGSGFNDTGGSSAQGLALLEVGASYPLTENLSVTAAYRYVHYFEDNEDVAHVVKMGIRYTF